MGDSPKPQSDGRTQVLLAVISVVGAVGVALIANWKSIFPPSQPPAQVNSPASSAGRGPEPLRIPSALDQHIGVLVSATEFINGSGVAIASGIVGRYGDVLMNGPPYEEARANSAEFEFRVPKSGSYRMWAEYASEVPRPVVIEINQRIITNSGLNAPTGCFEQGCQKWLNQGEVHLESGRNLLRLHRDGVFPHIRGFRFEAI